MDELYDESKSFLSNGDIEGSYKILCTIIDNCISQRPTFSDPEPSRTGETRDQILNAERLSDHQLADVYNSRGHIRYLWVNFNDAVEDYSEAIELNSKFGVAYYNRGQVHYRMGRYKKAEEDLMKALELMPDFEDARLNLNQVQDDVASGRRFNV